ncbi:unnamed protein product [Paramecium pentaurelia]|uniref:OTU domain-containing protein n=1 Tax=Paramecium pentaurelia TaxID=43138 RepID=A0A8S1U341_9CILI|nr:unnamed protein product [Paramecium pentaurelia]
MNITKTFITQLEQYINRVQSHYESIVKLISDAALLIGEQNIQLQQTVMIKEFWYIFAQLDEWINQGKIISQKLIEVNIIQYQQQQIIELSIQEEKNLKENVNLLNEFIENLEFLSGAQLLDINYVNPPENQVAFNKEYGIQKLDFENKCRNIIGYQRVRGDGNCFYTSFFYQYLKILLQNSRQNNRIHEFINKVNKLNLILFFNGQSLIKTQNEIEIKQYFNQVIQELLQNNSKLLEYFSKSNKIFYVCSITIFRNIVRSIYEEQKNKISNFLDGDLYEEIVTWSKECNTNQAIIQLLSQELNFQVNLYFFRRDGIDLEIYNQNQDLYQINLLFRPGHYQIAICQNPYVNCHQISYQQNN